jgi:hypothetical protein
MKAARFFYGFGLALGLLDVTGLAAGVQLTRLRGVPAIDGLYLHGKTKSYPVSTDTPWHNVGPPLPPCEMKMPAG